MPGEREVEPWDGCCHPLAHSEVAPPIGRQAPFCNCVRGAENADRKGIG
jgi:hypothetical protein